MRVPFGNFYKSEDGASLVEYAVALIVVTIIGGAGVIALGQNAGGVTEAACDTAVNAVTAAQNAGANISIQADACAGQGGSSSSSTSGN